MIHCTLHSEGLRYHSITTLSSVYAPNWVFVITASQPTKRIPYWRIVRVVRGIRRITIKAILPVLGLARVTTLFIFKLTWQAPFFLAHAKPGKTAKQTKYSLFRPPSTRGTRPAQTKCARRRQQHQRARPTREVEAGRVEARRFLDRGTVWPEGES